MAFKTNATRMVESKKLPHQVKELNIKEAVSGVECAALLGVGPELVYKTLVTVGASKQHYVFVIPAAKELGLKKAAKAAGEKNIEMVKSKDLLGLTGYVHGGCSPIGMKKPFPTYIDETAQLQDVISVSAGQRGVQVILSPDALTAYIGASFADLI